MKRKPPVNVAASVRARLLKVSKARGEDFTLTLMNYAAERFLSRLSRSRLRDQFVLKGAMLFAVRIGERYRPTRDLDLLGRGERTEAAIEAAIRDIATTTGGWLSMGTSSPSLFEPRSVAARRRCLTPNSLPSPISTRRARTTRSQASRTSGRSENTAGTASTGFGSWSPSTTMAGLATATSHPRSRAQSFAPPPGRATTKATPRPARARCARLRRGA